jgi:NADH-quinone oxidoreductase subunit H
MNEFIFSPQLLRIILAAVAVMAFVGANGLVLVYMERKLAGHFQRRPGPYEVGWHGILQPFVDAGKLIGKQLITPDGADPLLYWLAPVVAFVWVLALFIPIPFSPWLTAFPMDLGLVLILAFAGTGLLALCMAGWGSNNKWSLLGAARAVAQSVAYEIPLLLAILAVSFTCGTLNLSTIVEQQGSWPWQWNILTQPLAFAVYFICAVAETNRAPFDLPEAESELTAGFHTEYSGMAFGLFFLAEYANMIVVCAMATALFLGGWQGPFFSGVWWFLSKMYLLLIAMIWLRWTYPRVRFDQLLNINWKWLLPLSLINLMGTALFTKLF